MSLFLFVAVACLRHALMKPCLRIHDRNTQSDRLKMNSLLQAGRETGLDPERAIEMMRVSGLHKPATLAAANTAGMTVNTHLIIQHGK